jgi:endonuclease YncB( thermonuclease family)
VTTLRPAILSILCAAFARLGAQDAATSIPVPEEMVQLRRQFESRAIGNAKLLSEQYANALASIIKDSAAEGDYDQALAAQRRREQLIKLYSTSLDDTVLTNVVLLKPADARVNGAVGYDRSLNALTGWRTAGSIASWDVTRLTPGSYDVTLTYAVADIGDIGRTNPFMAPPDLTTGGEFEFYEDSNLPGADQNRRTAQVTTTGGWTNWTTVALPPLQLTRSSARLALRITRTRGEGGVMNLKGIRLSPASVTAGTGDSPKEGADGSSPPADEFATLQQAHVERLRQAITPVVNSYAATVKALAAKVAGDPEAAGDCNAEAQRAEQLLVDPQAFLAGSAKGRRPPAGLEGFRESRGVTYLPDAQNSGDRFKVKQGDEEFFVRLLAVACPPVDSKDTKLLKRFADYFGISVEDAQNIGQQAREFTAGYLSGKALAILTRGMKDDGGNLLVTVQPEGVGDFAGVLVDNGLAMIKAPAGRKGPARLHEESVLQDLQARERAAKERRIPPGGWARKSE